ncbi:MAG: carbamate kinase [Candidatus Binatia bacterium]
MAERWTIALGGHTILNSEALRHAAQAIVPLFGKEGGIVVHGNGPQVGELLLQNPKLPIDVAVAETQALIGYELVRLLDAEIGGQRAIAVVTRVVVEPDKATSRKPVGPTFPRQKAKSLVRVRHWDMGLDPGRGYRRWVLSPQPTRVVEEEAICALVEDGWIVVAGGGGGIPVHDMEGVEAVVDKDWTATLLAIATRSQRLVFLTSIPCAYEDFRNGSARPLSFLTPKEARQLLARRVFAEGSMAPKIEAACLFVERTGGRVLITDSEHLEAALESHAGTRIEEPKAS